MTAEMWAFGLLISLIVGQYLYIYNTSSTSKAEIAAAREKFAKELTDFREHVASEYVRAGAIDKLTTAIDKLTEKLEAVSTKVAIIVDRATK